MPSPQFTASEILDLIQEVGQVLHLCSLTVNDVGLTQAEGIGVRHRALGDCRRISAYCIPMSAREIALSGDDLKQGDYKGYILARSSHCKLVGSVSRDELSLPESVIRWNGTVYQISYNQEVVTRGIPVLHAITMHQTQESGHSPQSSKLKTVTQGADGVLRFK